MPEPTAAELVLNAEPTKIGLGSYVSVSSAQWQAAQELARQVKEHRSEWRTLYEFLAEEPYAGDSSYQAAWSEVHRLVDKCHKLTAERDAAIKERDEMARKVESMPPDDLPLIEQAIHAWFGQRCVEHEPECTCCQAWEQYDQLLDALNPKGTTNA